MDHGENEGKSVRWQKRQLVLALVMATVVAVIMGTLAWLNYERGLITMARMQMPILYLRDEAGSDISRIDLGSLDIGSTTPTLRVFGVYATADTQYMLQLSHTTNLPLSYKIYHASQSVLDGLTGKVDKFYYDDKNPIGGSQLTDTHAITFGSYEQVQYNSEPVYWQADDAREIKRGQTQYYVLEVNWEQSALSDAVKRSLYKETEMIYVTVATILEAGTETTGGGA